MIINSQKRSFGKGAKVSLFTLGTMRATESLEKMYSIIKNAYYAGINHIETAPSYGDAEFKVKAMKLLLLMIGQINDNLVKERCFNCNN